MERQWKTSRARGRCSSILNTWNMCRDPQWRRQWRTYLLASAMKMQRKKNGIRSPGQRTRTAIRMKQIGIIKWRKELIITHLYGIMEHLSRNKWRQLHQGHRCMHHGTRYVEHRQWRRQWRISTGTGDTAALAAGSSSMVRASRPMEDDRDPQWRVHGHRILNIYTEPY